MLSCLLVTGKNLNRQQTETEMNDCFSCISDFVAPRLVPITSLEELTFLNVGFGSIYVLYFGSSPTPAPAYKYFQKYRYIFVTNSNLNNFFYCEVLIGNTNSSLIVQIIEYRYR